QRRPRFTDRPDKPAAELRSVPDAGNPEGRELLSLSEQCLASLKSDSELDMASAGTREEEVSAAQCSCGGLRPILDLRALIRSLLRLPFKMLTTKRMLTCTCPQDWFAAIDLKEAYFHVSILPHLRPFRRFAYKVLPFGLHRGCPVPPKSWLMGIRILNYLNDWLLIAHSRDLLCEQRDVVLRHLRFQIGVSLQCRRLFSPWSRHLVVYTDASSTGRVAVCNGQAASGSWTGPRLQWHINCLELLAVLLALRRFRPTLRHKHVLPTSTIKVVYTPVACHNSPPSAPMESDVAEIATRRSRSRRTQPPPILENGDSTPRQSVCSPESSHCQLFYSLDEAPLGRDALAHSWPPGPNLLAQTLCKIREDEEQVLLVAPYWPTRTCPSLENPLEERPSFSGDGHNLAPPPRPVEPACLAPGRDVSDFSGLPQAVIETIT
ncbi:hypothetical protein M9458_007640, partial [Cirrhinus mrigala]